MFAKLAKPNLCLLIGLFVLLIELENPDFIFYQILRFALKLGIKISAFVGPRISFTTGTIIITTGLDLATQITAVQILNIEGIYTLEGQREDRAGKKRGVEMERERERFLILERGGLRNKGRWMDAKEQQLGDELFRLSFDGFPTTEM